MTSEADRGRIDSMKDNEARLSSLYDEYYDKIARYAYARIGDRAGAEDIAGEVFLKALESLGTYRERGVPMQAWLFKIAHNLVVDHLRKGARYRTVPSDTVEIMDKADLETSVDANMELQRVITAMRGLTGEQSEVVRLRFFGGLTSREVGSLLSKNAGAVREMQRAALEKLRQALNEGRPRDRR
ncbi:MAG: sigma-70 family RNA polymerase sigma factor [Dehalococcoidia bacterium]|nr:sigma-70 family RNA polymerase sigma factor [Dehalococcoidia bacterium]